MNFNVKDKKQKLESLLEIIRFIREHKSNLFYINIITRIFECFKFDEIENFSIRLFKSLININQNDIFKK